MWRALGRLTWMMRPTTTTAWVNELISSYIRKLQQSSAAEAEHAAFARPGLEERVAAIVGEGTTTRIPDLQRVLDADARAIGSALRAMGFKRKRIWSGDD